MDRFAEGQSAFGLKVRGRLQPKPCSLTPTGAYLIDAFGNPLKRGRPALLRLCLPQRLRPSAGDQVEDKDDQRYDQEKMNQAAGYMKAEAQEPQNQNDNKNCPEHSPPFLHTAGTRVQNLPRAPEMHSPPVTNF
jgi:hypothetical protein